MKIDTLTFTHTLLTMHPPAVFHPYIDVLLHPVIAAVGDSFYKITAEALLVLQQFVKVGFVFPFMWDSDLFPAILCVSGGFALGKTVYSCKAKGRYERNQTNQVFNLSFM